MTYTLASASHRLNTIHQVAQVTLSATVMELRNKEKNLHPRFASSTNRSIRKSFLHLLYISPSRRQYLPYIPFHGKLPERLLALILVIMVLTSPDTLLQFLISHFNIADTVSTEINFYLGPYCLAHAPSIFWSSLISKLVNGTH